MTGQPYRPGSHLGRLIGTLLALFEGPVCTTEGVTVCALRADRGQRGNGDLPGFDSAPDSAPTHPSRVARQP
jgi:hypothetical protein